MKGSAVSFVVVAAAMLPLAVVAGFHGSGGTTAPRGDAAASGTTAGAPRTADAARGAELFRTCAACHTVGRGGPDVDGPNLYGVVGAPVAERRPRYGYTQALRDAGGVWSAPRLDAWLKDPAAFAPGTAMRFAGLADARDRADVIAFLATQGPTRP
jgi:cytochrome c